MAGCAETKEKVDSLDGASGCLQPRIKRKDRRPTGPFEQERLRGEFSEGKEFLD